MCGSGEDIKAGKTNWGYVVRNSGFHDKEFGLYPESNKSYEGFLSRGGTRPKAKPFYRDHSIKPHPLCAYKDNWDQLGHLDRYNH